MFLFLKKLNEVGYMKKLKKFFAGVKKEMDKVRWLTKKEMLTYSIATLSIMVIFALFFFMSDFIIGSVKMLVA